MMGRDVLIFLDLPVGLLVHLKIEYDHLIIGKSMICYLLIAKLSNHQINMRC